MSCDECKKNIKCIECEQELCVDCSCQCELCYEWFCWDHIAMDDQGSDPRCFCEDCYDFCYEQGIFSESEKEL